MAAISPETLACWVLQQQRLQELHWLEWKTLVDLGQREWQARVAKFVLGAANRSAALARTKHDGHAFMLLGLEPGALIGTTVVDPATVDAGLVRYLGKVGPNYQLEYITLRKQTIAVITVLPVSIGSRPLLARGSFYGPNRSSKTAASMCGAPRPPRRPTRPRLTTCSRSG